MRAAVVVGAGLQGGGETGGPGYEEGGGGEGATTLLARSPVSPPLTCTWSFPAEEEESSGSRVQREYGRWSVVPRKLQEGSGWRPCSLPRVCASPDPHLPAPRLTGSARGLQGLAVPRKLTFSPSVPSPLRAFPVGGAGGRQSQAGPARRRGSCF